MKSPTRGAGNRGLLNHGGKGDADRTADSKSFSSNFDEIDFPSRVLVDGFVQTQHGARKVYGLGEPKQSGPHICVK